MNENKYLAFVNNSLTNFVFFFDFLILTMFEILCVTNIFIRFGENISNNEENELMKKSILFF